MRRCAVQRGGADHEEGDLYEIGGTAERAGAGELADLLRSSYDGSADLPEDARDTGYRRDGRELWLGGGGDAAYLVSVDDPSDVERWPATKEPFLCA